MVAYAEDQGWSGGSYKKLNLPFENRFLSEPREVRQRMATAVEDFTYHLLTEVFNAKDTADIAKEILLEAGGPDPGPNK
jgi:hypothetical protein